MTKAAIKPRKPTRKAPAPRQTAEEIARLKDEYVSYYADVPVQKYAAMAIGRIEETIINWRRDDPEFSNRVEKARAAWVRKKTGKVKAEFALERLEKDVFAQRTELTGKDGKPIEVVPVQVMQVDKPDGHQPKAK